MPSNESNLKTFFVENCTDESFIIIFIINSLNLLINIFFTQRICLFLYFCICKLFFFYYTCKISLSISSTCLYMNIIYIKTTKKLVQMSCTAYIVYTFQLSLHHANFGQVKAKQVLYSISFICMFSPNVVANSR